MDPHSEAGMALQNIQIRQQQAFGFKVQNKSSVMTTEENQSEDPFRNNDSSYKKSNNTESLFWNRD